MTLLLFQSPDVNPITRKARSITILNPFDLYSRVFFFSWFGFMIAFLSWYAFPPLVCFSPMHLMCVPVVAANHQANQVDHHHPE